MKVFDLHLVFLPFFFSKKKKIEKETRFISFLHNGNHSAPEVKQRPPPLISKL